MHIIKDENGNVFSHAHEHEHTHTHTYEHSHAHSHEHGHEDVHDHSHEESGDCCHSHEGDGHCHNHGEHSHCAGGHCHNHEEQTAPGNKNAALLKYMLDHNTHHAAELDQMAEKLISDGQEKAAQQIRKAVDEFQKGNLYLGLALSLLEE
ncbi:MAG: cobalt transporter [Eubacteriales bacterium]|nr:cobalt transporter [Eubacteriales bacterium]